MFDEYERGQEMERVQRYIDKSVMFFENLKQKMEDEKLETIDSKKLVEQWSEFASEEE